MSFDAVALAQADAQVIVTAMATESWAQIRARVGQLFGRGDDQRRQRALAELDEARVAVGAASTDADARDAQVELRALLKARLRDDPDLAAQFAALVDELAARLEAPAPATVTQRASADRGSTVIQAGRDANTGPGAPAGRSDPR
jgi:hypothetical protein